MGDDRVAVRPEDLDRLADTLTSSLGGLRGQAPAGEVDAGISTGVVLGTMASLYDSVARMMADTEHAAGEVTHAGGEYTRSDDQAASEFPPLAIPPNLEGSN